MIGASMLWVGWFLVERLWRPLLTHISAAAAASLTWALWERIKFGKSSLVGNVTGTNAGLASITPALGFVTPALIIGLVAGIPVPGGGEPDPQQTEDRRYT